ncbi:unnamed protein product [Dovyalis caffra]|uniref:PRA1 family protein n=1 Tax=Dovyalis caffra TaxID=77055 RepID=A0AAV1S216_9ROSI|nr:unnamed protein product [Dovyalis caffra]
MDWGNVTPEDLIDALREVDWSSPPRPFSEFFSRFTLPKSSAKWNSRLKCNLYYYRTNYFIMILLILGLGFLRRPLAIVAALLTALSIALLNDRGKVVISEVIIRWGGAAIGILNQFTLVPCQNSSGNNTISVPVINGSGPKKQDQFLSLGLEFRMLVNNVSSFGNICIHA